MMQDADTVSGDTVVTDSSELPIDRANEDFATSFPSAEELRTSVQPIRKSKSRTCLYCSLVFVIVVALAVGLGVGLSDRNGLRSSKIIDDSQERKATFAQVISYVTEQGVSDLEFETENSPQSKAALWLAEVDPLNVKVPEEGIDSDQGYQYMSRYVLALLYYATDGPNWQYKFNFMSGQDICQWTGILYSGSQFYRSGVLCDQVTGEFWALYLGKYSIYCACIAERRIRC